MDEKNHEGGTGTPRKTVLDVVSQWVFIVACVVLATLAVLHYVSRPAPPGAKESSLKGKRIVDPSLMAQSPRITVLVVVSSSCRFCEDSMGFYARLAEAAAKSRGQVRLVFTAIESEARTVAFLNAHGVRSQGVVAMPSTLQITATPTLFVIRKVSDDAGEVKAGWIGQLDAAQERQAIEATSG
jgi:hypothetical protein